MSIIIFSHEIFRTSLYSVDSKCQTSYRYSLKTAWDEQEVNFRKKIFSSCIQVRRYCATNAFFLYGVRWRHNRPPNFERRVFWSISCQFEDG